MLSVKVLCVCTALGIATSAGAQGRENRIYKMAVVALTNDPALGVLRHADAGYAEALRTADERGVHIPMVETRR